MKISKDLSSILRDAFPNVSIQIQVVAVSVHLALVEIPTGKEIQDLGIHVLEIGSLLSIAGLKTIAPSDLPSTAYVDGDLEMDGDPEF